MHWLFTSRSYLLSTIADFLRSSERTGEKTESVHIVHAFVDNCCEPVLSQWLLLQLNVMEIVTINLNMGTTTNTLELVNVCLGLLATCFSRADINEIQKTVNKVSLPWELQRQATPQRKSKTLTEEFERAGGLNALEQLQFCQNAQIYERVQKLIQDHFGEELPD